MDVNLSETLFNPLQVPNRNSECMEDSLAGGRRGAAGEGGGSGARGHFAYLSGLLAEPRGEKIAHHRPPCFHPNFPSVDSSLSSFWMKGRCFILDIEPDFILGDGSSSHDSATFTFALSHKLYDFSSVKQGCEGGAVKVLWLCKLWV